MAAGAIMMIEQELELMQNNYEWTWTLWDSLPAFMLEKVCTAPDSLSMLDAFKVEGLVVEEFDKMKAKVASNAKGLAWLNLGLGDLRSWWDQKQKDPSFDPAADEEGEE